MQQIRIQPAGPKAFHLYSIMRDIYRAEIGERAFRVYEALTYYVEPKTLQGTVPLKLLSETVRFPLATVSRYLHRLGEQGFITITPQWDTFECVPQANLYALHRLPLKPVSHQPVQLHSTTSPEPRQLAPRLLLARRSVRSRPQGDMPA
jgi:hypothetical protein